MPVLGLFLTASVFAGLTFGVGKSNFDPPFRPQFRFSPEKNWTNNPNGLVYFEGEYHFFFQFNPFADLWGHMSWGHAVSRDPIHWQQLAVGLPEENGIAILTGSTVVDEHNASGFYKDGHVRMVAIYTGYSPEVNEKKGSDPLSEECAWSLRCQT